MPQIPVTRPSRHFFSGRVYQGLAVLACVLLGLAMVANNQMGGESMWFWYATVFHHGAKLYSQLHTALQPFFVLETDLWLQLLGQKIMLEQIASLFQILSMCLALFLVLRESDWPDWQKACVLLGAFALTVSGHSYRFDDYHVVAETFIFYALAVLCIIARTEAVRRQLGLVTVLGVLCGLTFVTRLTDGAALLAASALSFLFLLRRRKLASIALMCLAGALTVVLVVRMTGDSFSSYVSNSIIHAAGSKGGTGSIFAAPFLMLRNTLHPLFTQTKRVLAVIALIVAIGPLVFRFWKAGIRYIFGLQLAAALLAFCLVPHVRKVELLHGSLISVTVLLLTTLMYVLPIVVLVRLIVARKGNRAWDVREVLVLLPLAEWASYSAGAAAEPLTNYYAPVALLLLLVPVVQPFRTYARWANVSFATVMMLLAFSSISGKIITPYSWQNYRYGSMFVNRQWYHHPIYGEMYIDKDLLQFSEAVCSDLGEGKNIGVGLGPGRPELLSLPYPYPNYFCDTPPWHNYVQTFFDTSTQATIEHLMSELDSDPPQYIVYQRQLNIMNGSERLYNHGHPWAQRALDTMIMQKLASGQWHLIEKRNFLPLGEGWFIIQTHP
jgi:hypothetical protein